MKEYDRIQIQDICTRICSGGTPKSTVEEYYGGAIPWLNTKEVNFNRIHSTEKKITEKGLQNSSAKILLLDVIEQRSPNLYVLHSSINENLAVYFGNFKLS